MAKRGETRPWRMRYKWTGLAGGVLTYRTEQQARDAARQQVRLIGGRSGVRDCTASVHRRETPEQVTHYKACPSCGEVVTWDTEHFPPAWRHDHDSRWCELPADSDATEPVMPPNTMVSPR